MESIHQRQALTLEIERVRGEIVEGVLEEMYQDPFWDARFGERGRKHTRQDTNYHLNYLVAALELNNPASLVTYFHWLQGLLVYRGMCTLHLRETIASLGHQIARLLPDPWPAIRPVLEAGYRGLYYDHHDCQSLEAGQERIARAVAERVVPRGDPGDAEEQERRRQVGYRDNLYLLSYLADAVAYNSGKIFTDYVGWLRGFFPGQNRPAGYLEEDLRVLAEEVENEIGGGVSASKFVELIEKVR